MKSICHLSSVHPASDTRIFYKECTSLAKVYSPVYLVACAAEDYIENNVKVKGVVKKERFKRVFYTVNEVLDYGLALNADVYHLHDPELLRIVPKLKKEKKLVVYDMHENTSLQILNKSYIPQQLRNVVSKVFSSFETRILKKVDALIFAEWSYESYFKHFSGLTEVVLNMPDVKNIPVLDYTSSARTDLFYLGTITKDRCILIILEAIDILNTRGGNIHLQCVGAVPEWLPKHFAYKKVADNVTLHGRLPLYQALAYAKNSLAGISILKPIGNYEHSYSTKIFEYMAMGLPVITSNFKLYTDVVEKHNTGLCINPNSSNSLADAIENIQQNKTMAETMAKNGRNIVKREYNWTNEEKKLLKIYKELFTLKERSTT